MISKDLLEEAISKGFEEARKKISHSEQAERNIKKLAERRKKQKSKERKD